MVISQTLTEAMKRYRIEGLVISEIDDVMVNSIDDVKEIFKNKSPNEPVSIVFNDKRGERNRFIFD